MSKLLAMNLYFIQRPRNAIGMLKAPTFIPCMFFLNHSMKRWMRQWTAFAERIRQLGHYAPATLQSFLSLTHLTENWREK